MASKKGNKGTLPGWSNVSKTFLSQPCKDEQMHCSPFLMKCACGQLAKSSDAKIEYSWSAGQELSLHVNCKPSQLGDIQMCFTASTSLSYSLSKEE